MRIGGFRGPRNITSVFGQAHNSINIDQVLSSCPYGLPSITLLSMVQARRRVSYIIPAPEDPVPRLQLPPHGVSRLGATGPLLIPYHGSDDERQEGSSRRQKHPRHRLGVASLALDVSTQLIGRNAPEGILYSGGRDGLVMSWDLEMPMKRRKISDGNSQPRRGRWEVLTGWGEDFIEEEAEEGDERPVSDGDILGDVVDTLKKRRQASLIGEIPEERQWETDWSVFEPGVVSEPSLTFIMSYSGLSSELSSVSALKRIATGSMISFCAIIIKQVRIYLNYLGNINLNPSSCICFV